MQLTRKAMVLVQQRAPGTTCSAALAIPYLTFHIVHMTTLQPRHTLVLVMCMKLATPERMV